jgi:hypothetical protein
LASLRACTMASVQFPPGVKHTVTAEGVVVVLGHRAGGAGVGVDEDALRGLPTKSVHRGLVQWTLRKTGQIEVSAIHVYQCHVVRFRQYRLSGHWSHRPLSPQTYLPVSDGQLWSPWQGSWWAWLATIQAPRSTMAIRLVRSNGRDITQTSLWGTYGVTQRS